MTSYWLLNSVPVDVTLGEFSNYSITTVFEVSALAQQFMYRKIGLDSYAILHGNVTLCLSTSELPKRSSCQRVSLNSALLVWQVLGE